MENDTVVRMIRKRVKKLGLNSGYNRLVDLWKKACTELNAEMENEGLHETAKAILKHCENMPDFHNEKGETIDPFKKGKMVEPEGGEQSSEHIVGAGDATIGHTDRPAEGSFAYNTMITVDEAD